MFNSEKIQANKITFPGIFMGVVENNNDPDRAGKVQVRILGLHSENKNKSNTDGIPTNELPWAVPAVPIAEGGTSGSGMFSVPVQGSWVALFFIGGDHNYPCYFASIAGNPKTKRPASKGFSDPDGIYPKVLNEPDWNPNARGEGELIKDTKNENREIGIEQYKSDAWDEPESPAATEYPHNAVFATHNEGIVVEYDSTPNKERYHIYHKKSGNYFEIAENGQTVFKSIDNNFEINVKDKNIAIKGNENKSIVGDQDTKIKGSENKEVVGNVDTKIGGNITETVIGELNITVTGPANIISSALVKITAPIVKLN